MQIGKATINVGPLEIRLGANGKARIRFCHRASPMDLAESGSLICPWMIATRRCCLIGL